MWLYLPSTDSPSAPASECSTKACDLHSSILDSTTALSLTSKGKPLLLPSLLRLWKRGSSIRRLSGLTSSPSTLARGVESWTASLRASRASHTASQESAPALKMTDGSGPTLPALLASYDRVSSCWRTSQGSLLPEDSTAASAILPPEGTARNGRAYLRLPLALHTSGSGSSSSGGWPTPDCNTATYSNGMFGMNIREAAANWATPTAQADQGPDDSARQGGPNLWMTPNVPNGGRRLSEEFVAAKGATPDGKRQVGLEMQTEYWPTPAARDHKSETGGAATMSHFERPSGPTLSAFIEHSPQVPAMKYGKHIAASSPTSRRRLNPAFACWLMGWPWWWTNPALTSSAQSAMASWRSQQRARMSSLLDAPSVSSLPNNHS